MAAVQPEPWLWALITNNNNNNNNRDLNRKGRNCHEQENQHQVGKQTEVGDEDEIRQRWKRLTEKSGKLWGLTAGRRNG
jgi:hypothetical protein